MSTGGNLIHEARLRAGLSQAQLADRLGTSQPAVARWETGGSRPAMDRVVEALHACGLDLMVSVIERDDHDLLLALGNLRRSPTGRLGQFDAMAGFVQSAAGARRRSRTDRVSEDVPAAPLFQPREILRALAECDVDYVLIGGLAAVLHGAPHFTADVDICPDASRANLKRLAAALVRLDAHIRTTPGADPVTFPRDGAFLSRMLLLNLTTRAGDLDLAYQPDGTRGYADLRRAAKTLDLDGVPVTVASLADVIRSKEAAGRPKDVAALHTLRELLRRQHD